MASQAAKAPVDPSSGAGATNRTAQRGPLRSVMRAAASDLDFDPANAASVLVTLCVAVVLVGLQVL